MCLLQDSFVAHGRQDVLTAAIGQPEHPGRVCAAGAGVTIKQYFGQLQGPLAHLCPWFPKTWST